MAVARKRQLKRNIRLNKENRQQRVAELYCQQKTQHEIAEIVGVTQACISGDLSEIRERWLQSSQMNMTARLAREIAALDNIERLAMEAYEESKEDAVMITTEKMPVGKKRKNKDGEEVSVGKKVIRITKTSEQRKGQVGNPAFLAEARACVEKRCKLLGLLDERAVNINNNTNTVADFSTLFVRKDDPQLNEKRTPILMPVDDPLEQEIKRLEEQANQKETTQ